MAALAASTAYLLWGSCSRPALGRDVGSTSLRGHLGFTSSSYGFEELLRRLGLHLLFLETLKRFRLGQRNLHTAKLL